MNIFAENAAKQLRKDIDDIDNALESFLNDRLAATRLQDDAFDAYEAEMKQIDATEQE